MSQVSRVPAFWIQHGSATSARERLASAVAGLTRARHLQALIDYGFCGLFFGLVLGAVAILVARLLALHYPLWQLAVMAVGVGLVIGLVLGWRQRPNPLEVAIRADLTLKLKQRLSTAWEFMAAQGDTGLTEQLAVQAVRAGLPARPETVFPLQVNRWGRLAPLAAVALILVSVLDLNWLRAPVAHEVDEQVVSEGQRLSAFGRAMQARARRDDLPRSAKQAAELQRLGSKMEGGALSRGQALLELQQVGESLEQDRLQVLAEAKPISVGPLRAGSDKDGFAVARLDPRGMLARMRRGALDDGDIRTLAERVNELERSGISQRELEQALRRHQAGRTEELEKLLEKLARLDRARKEAQELRGARDQVLWTLRNLGESIAAETERNPIADLDGVDDFDLGNQRGDPSAKAGVPGRRERGAPNKASRAGSRGDSSVALERRESPTPADRKDSGPVLMPESQPGKGQVFMSQARVPPRASQPSVENTPLSSEFAQQVEEVLSKEQYPAHYKAFVRRYFLNLSQGEAPQQPSAERGAP